MKWILLVALWTPDGLRAEGYEYSEQGVCEQVAARFSENIEGSNQLLELWCYPVREFAEVTE